MFSALLTARIFIQAFIGSLFFFHPHIEVFLTSDNDKVGDLRMIFTRSEKQESGAEKNFISFRWTRRRRKSRLMIQWKAVKLIMKKSLRAIQEFSSFFISFFLASASMPQITVYQLSSGVHQVTLAPMLVQLMSLDTLLERYKFCYVLA